MQNRPTFSIIIPYKGRIGFVKEAFKSIARQKGIKKGEIETLAVGDRKGDEETTTILKREFPWVKYLSPAGYKGPAGRRNAGLLKAKGEYITFLDSDDKLKPNFLKEMVSVLKNNPSFAGAVCMSEKIFESNFSIKEKIKRLYLIAIQEFLFLVSYIFNNLCMYKSSFYLGQVSHMMFKAAAIKGLKFNYDYINGGEDWDYILKVLLGSRIRIVLRRLIYFRYSPTSLTFDKRKLKNKWVSYSLLASRLPKSVKRGLFSKLFLIYIASFRK